MTYRLFDYQERDYWRLRQAAKDEHDRIIYQGPCGMGKTVVACHLIQNCIKRGKRALFLAPRRELIGQCAEKLDENGIGYRVKMPNFRPGSGKHPVTLASCDTLWRRLRDRGREFLPPADLIIFDECHLASDTRQKLLDEYPNSRIIGLSATPARPNGGQGLDGTFNHLIIGPTHGELLEKGRIVPARVFKPSAPSMKGVRTQNGDYSPSQMEQKYDKPKLVADVVKTWAQHASNRKTIVYTTGVKHSMHLAERFQKLGYAAEHIDGAHDSMERDWIMDRFRRGEIQILCNCQLLCYGLDVPDVSCASLAFATKSLVKYKQVVGRVIRAAEGKADAIVLDHGDNASRHGLPDEDIPWVLDTGGKSISEVREERGTPPKTVTCKNCSAVYPKGQPNCPECGELAPDWITCQNCQTKYRGRPDCPECAEPAPRRKPEAPEVEEGELVEVKRRRANREATLEDKKKFWKECIGQCIHKNKMGRNTTMGAAVHMYKDRFGVVPFQVKGLEPMPRGKDQWRMKALDWYRAYVANRSTPQENDTDGLFAGGKA